MADAHVLVLHTAERRKRSQSAPREVVAGVPHSSLHGHATDSTSTEFRSRTHADSTSSSTEDELGPHPAALRYGRVQQKSAQADMYRSEGARSDLSSHDGNCLQNRDFGDSCKQQPLQQHAAHRPGSSASNAGGKSHQRGKLDGSKAGVGLFFVQNAGGGACVVDEIINGSTAHKDGRIMVGDVLLSVDGVGVQDKDLSDVRKMIVGDPGTQVALQVQRGETRLRIQLIRSVPQPTDTPANEGAVAWCGAECSSSSSAGRHVTVAAEDRQAHASASAGRKVSRDPSVDASSSSHGNAASAPQSVASTPQREREVSRNFSHASCNSGNECDERCRALCAFTAQRDHEICLEPGEMLIITR